jgi:hypothetical protein
MSRKPERAAIFELDDRLIGFRQELIMRHPEIRGRLEPASIWDTSIPPPVQVLF